MEPIIPKVSRQLIERELTDNKFVRTTNYGNREIYIVSYHNSPNVVREVGRLREIAFRDGGGGTGKELDLDQYDVAPVPFQQLIVWDAEEKEIIGGYRFIRCDDLEKDENGDLVSPTSKLFNITDKFIEEFAPRTIELGRSFIQPTYQAGFNIRKGMFSLDNLWDGLGALIVKSPEIQYFFGKMTIYEEYNSRAKDLLFTFFEKYFPDPDNLVYPKEAVEIKGDKEAYKNLFTENTYEGDYKILNKEVRLVKENIPPLVNAYMNLSPSMRVFGTSKNKGFGNVEETGMIITINDVYEKKKSRHLSLDITSKILNGIKKRKK